MDCERPPGSADVEEVDGGASGATGGPSAALVMAERMQQHIVSLERQLCAMGLELEAARSGEQASREQAEIAQLLLGMICEGDEGVAV